MKIAVLSDIHGNVSALETAVADIDRWQPDMVVVNGDVVNRGPCSPTCLALIQSRQRQDGWHVLRGNHEEYLLYCGRPNAPKSGPEYEISRFAHWTYDQLGADTVGQFAHWPAVFTWMAPDNSEFRVTHASMDDNRDGIYPRLTDGQIAAKIGEPPAVYVTSHTHVPMMRQVGSTAVVNIGAVGSPFDSDRRLSYGRFTWQPSAGWRSEIVRLPYDYEQIERDYVTSGFLDEAGPFTQLMLVELRKARGLVFRWASRYQEQLLAGKLSMEASIRDLLRDDDLRPFVGPPGWTVPSKNGQSPS